MPGPRTAEMEVTVCVQSTPREVGGDDGGGPSGAWAATAGGNEREGNGGMA